MNLKGFLVGSVGAVVLLGSQLAFAWEAGATQRGWVDFISTGSYPGPIVGPTQTLGFHGWACVRPGWADYGVPSTQVAVYHGGPPGVGNWLPVLDVRQAVPRYDVVAAGACANINNGFSVWVAKPVTYPSYYYVVFQGPYGNTTLEGQIYF
ncbi:hypothetical protein F0U62_13385 [Cystobacter fuscus]|uniref:hypothetical protein n=1 Tax=Cystobacter fuscus TaxID=43 RepID=UPI002B2F4664|nr:hypothetical protein F0U62_13385 [Cystobacter fuscus]